MAINEAARSRQAVKICQKSNAHEPLALLKLAHKAWQPYT